MNLDYTGTDGPTYQRILTAVEGAGWNYVETSAMAYEGDLEGVRRALDVLARVAHLGGTLSALTVQVQLIGEMRETPGPWAPDPSYAWALEHPSP